MYAITLRDTGELTGAISLTEITDTDANLGYWLGVPYWGMGYDTETVRSFMESCLLN